MAKTNNPKRADWFNKLPRKKQIGIKQEEEKYREDLIAKYLAGNNIKTSDQSKPEPE